MKINHLARQRQKQSRLGASAVETALMLPILIIITFGSIDLAQYINSGQVVANSAREAARVATRADSKSEVETAIKNYLMSAIPNLPAEKIAGLIDVDVQHVTFGSSSASGSTHSGTTTGGNGNSGGNGKGKGKGVNSTTTSTSSQQTYQKVDISKQNNNSISNGDLSSIDSGECLLLTVSFDFSGIRWLRGIDFPEQSFKTYCRRE